MSFPHYQTVNARRSGKPSVGCLHSRVSQVVRHAVEPAAAMPWALDATLFNRSLSTLPTLGHNAMATQEDTVIESRIAIARRMADEKGMTFYVCTIDKYNGRAVCILTDDQIDDDEFDAFDGKVIEVVEPSEVNAAL